MHEKMMIDADICIKLGQSEKYQFLKDVLPLVAKEIYIHSQANNEVMQPKSARQQLDGLINANKVKVVNETDLIPKERAVYDMAFNTLAEVMLNPSRPNKNLGETSSLAYAKVKGIPIFATDEYDLQQIIDAVLNTGIADIHCLRITDIVEMAHNGEIDLPRKMAKVLWAIAGKNKADFDNHVWRIE